MFEDLVDPWKQYLELRASAWAPDDPRHNLAAEVRKRFVHIDIVLQYLQAALTAVSPDSEKNREVFAQSEDDEQRLDAGTITAAEYKGRSLTRKKYDRVYARAWDEVNLFTEAFYFVAWRLVCVLRRKGRFAFPGFTGLRAKGIRDVRNQLLEHPENQGGNFQQVLIVTNAGPVLKSATYVVRSSTGMSEPGDESTDRGLFVNAQELHEELLKLFAATRSTLPSSK